MNIRNFKHFLGEALRSIFKNRLMSIASVITVASCLLILALSYSVISNLDHMLSGLSNDLELSAFLDNDISDTEIDAIRDEILRIDHVVDIHFVSHQEAEERFQERFGDGNILRGLEGRNALPRSFDIRVNSVENQEFVKNNLDLLIGRGVTDVVFVEDVAESFVALSRGLQIGSITIIAFLSAVSAIIIMNTIKLTVNSRKNEINIMKYVGATDWFIRWPFIIEGVLIGLFGALLAVGVSLIAYTRVVGYEADIPLINFLTDFMPTSAIFAFLIPFCVLLGVAIGVVGSTISIRKHLFV
ncbi:MAG: permease-like cell division protein FtsX [Defluviitaleaceae bacterium]|nr:permease-like cell division protein FtsX [Defluviitaleaceae bacterium]